MKYIYIDDVDQLGHTVSVKPMLLLFDQTTVQGQSLAPTKLDVFNDF